jgi:hypothetical protein
VVPCRGVVAFVLFVWFLYLFLVRNTMTTSRAKTKRREKWDLCGNVASISSNIWQSGY